MIERGKERLKKTKKVKIFFSSGKDEKDQDEAHAKKEEQKKNKKKKKRSPKKDHKPEEIEKAAQFASEATGVRKDFLMGMLVVESDLGRNTGECSYKQVEEDAAASYQKGLLGEAAWNTFLERKDLIKGIADELDYDYEELTVSCNPTSYTGTGGALGIPQFMPDTWLDYKEKISEIVGKEHPDPWNVRDGVVAMAVKVTTDVPAIKNYNPWAERIAAKLYLSGSTSWRYDWYANEIFYWSVNYKKLLS
jgi:hypothetical protein